MLESLQIRNYVLIDSLDIRFPEGLIIISGQTGAGKSILLGALSLLLGSKADASVIGGEADSCVVEAVFRIPESDLVLKEILDDNDVEAGDGELIIRRVVNRSGRSRSFINDSPVNIQILQSISSVWLTSTRSIRLFCCRTSLSSFQCWTTSPVMYPFWRNVINPTRPSKPLKKNIPKFPPALPG